MMDYMLFIELGIVIAIIILFAKITYCARCHFKNSIYASFLQLAYILTVSQAKALHKYVLHADLYI